MKYEIIETCRYRVEAESEEAAEQKFLAADSVTRDADMFFEVSDRNVFPSSTEHDCKNCGLHFSQCVCESEAAQ